MFNESVFVGPQGAPGRYGKPGRSGEYFKELTWQQHIVVEPVLGALKTKFPFNVLLVGVKDFSRPAKRLKMS